MSASRYQGLMVVIPTRNRADLAINAIRSALKNSDGDLCVTVSDNSTLPEEVERLSNFCRQLSDERLRYVRPPQSLSMTEHWEWALRQSLADSSASHVAYLTDRMVFKSDALGALLRLVARYPDRVISYNNDLIIDYLSPLRLDQASWTGRLFELNSADLLAVFARTCDWRFFVFLPRMLNCVVPRDVLDLVAARFGNLFLSISPDLCFAYRCLERLDSILYYDRAVIISYAHTLSNGASYTRGIDSRDAKDFAANLKGKSPHYAAPVPEFKTSMNGIVHEYCFVKEESQSAKFPELDRKNYLDSMEEAISHIENPELKREMQLLLEKCRYELPAAEDEPPSAKSHGMARKVSRLSPRYPRNNKFQISRGLVWLVGRKVSRLSPRWLVSIVGPPPFWSFLENRFGLDPRAFQYRVSEFETVEAALAYADEHERAKNRGAALVDIELQARRLARY